MAKNKERQERRNDGVYIRDGVYYIRFKDWQGRYRRQATTARTLTQARQFRDLEQGKAEGIRRSGNPPPAPPPTTTFEEFESAYLEHKKGHLSAAAYLRTEGIVTGHLRAHFGSMRLVAISTDDVEKYLVQRGEDVSPGTVIREFNVLKNLLNRAVFKKKIPASPAYGVRAPKQPTGRLQYLANLVELQRLLAACPTWLQPIVALAVYTGMRQGEVLGLRPMDIDRQGHVAILRHTKNGKPRLVPLMPQAMAVIDPLRPNQPSDQKLFDIEQRNRVSVAFARAARKAKIHNFTFHDLRHTFASWAVMAGASLRTVADILGHDVKMVTRYAHLSPQFKEQEVGRLSTMFAGMLTSGSQTATQEARA